MRSRGIKARRSPAARLKLFFHPSELYKPRRWLKGKSLHWSLYLAAASLVLASVLGLHSYLESFFYVVYVGNREVGYVRDAAEIELFVDSLAEKCSHNYGMPVAPRERIALNWEYRPGKEADASAVKDALRQNMTMVTNAVVLTVDQKPIVPVASAEVVDTVVELLGDYYFEEAENVRLLETSLAEEVGVAPCSVRPEELYAAEEVVALLTVCESDREPVALSRGSSTREADAEDDSIPLVHVFTVEEQTVTEPIPFTTRYVETDSLWSCQSRIVTPGRNGSKEVIYHVTRENGEELSRTIVAETVLEEPVTQVVERGTATAPAMGTGQFIWPVEGGGWLTQGYSGWAHPGIDICPNGTARYSTRILAADSGVVVETGSEYPMGNYIIIYHGDYYSLYLHNKSISVSQGQTVSRGDVIAIMGNTGRTYGRTGIHLHFEIRAAKGPEWGHYRKHPPQNPLNFFSPK